jgi:lipoprotein LprG
MSWKSTARSLTVVAALALVVGPLAACKNNSSTTASADTGPLPAATDLIAQAQTAMGNVQTVHFTIGIDGTIASLPISKADGVLTKAGDAKGTATVSELGAQIEADFVIVGDDFYLKALGSYQKMPLADASQVYDPSAILDPNRGISKVLGAAKNPKTVGSDTIDGKTAYKVTIDVDTASVASLIPGAGDGTTGTIWIDKDSHHLVKGAFAVPSSGKTATVTITLNDYDAPVSISAP